MQSFGIEASKKIKIGLASPMKAWLARRTQGLLGVERLVQSQGMSAQQLQALRHALADSQAAAQARSDAAEAQMQAMIRLLESIDGRLDELASFRADSRTQPEPSPPFDGETLKKIETQGLFILGSARSGTSVLAKCLNRSPEIFVLEEPDLFLNEHVQDFAAFFNAKHAAMGNTPYKGTYVSPPVVAEQGPLGLVQRLCRQYRYAGEKVAIGPHEYPPQWKQLYVDYHAKYFLRSTHFLTVRTPNETLWSMHKLFPASPIPRLIEAWLESLSVVIDTYRVCPHSYFSFFEDFGGAALQRMAQLLDVEIDVPESMLGGNHVSSRLEPGELPPPLAPYAGLCRECAEVYEEVRENTCRQNWTYCGSAPEWHFFAKLQQRIQALVARSRAANGTQLAAA